MLHDVVSRLAQYDSTDLVEVNLPGARTYFNTTVRRLGNHGKRSQKGFEQPTVRNLLKKGTVYRHHDRVLKMLEDWAGPEPIRVWMSNTIPLDFNLHVDHIPEHSVLQVIALCRKRPAVVLSLYEAVGPTPETQTTNTEDNMKELAREFSAEIAQYLSSSLLNFCHRDFVLLPCGLACDGLTKKDLTAEISEQLAYISDFYSGPQRLNLSTFNELQAAMEAVAAVTNVPCFLENPNCNPMWLLLLEDDWHDALSLLIEMLVANKGRDAYNTAVLTYTKESEFKVKVAVVETAKRLSARETVIIASSDENVRSCARKTLRQTQIDDDVELRLTVISPEETPPSSQHYICIDQPSGNSRAPSLSVDKEFSLLLLGRKGRGRRSTVQAILGDKLFDDSFSGSSSAACTVHHKKRQGIKIHMMDSPRLLDGSLDYETVAAVRKAVSEIEDGIDAVLCHLHVGSYKEHEVRAYNKELRKILARNVHNYMIIVFTHGDLGSGGMKKYLDEAPEDLKQLLDHCDGRYVVFNKMTEDTLPQVHMLLEQVRKVRTQSRAALDFSEEEIERKLTEVYDSENTSERFAHECDSGFHSSVSAEESEIVPKTQRSNRNSRRRRKGKKQKIVKKQELPCEATYGSHLTEEIPFGAVQLYLFSLVIAITIATALFYLGIFLREDFKDCHRFW